MRKVFADDPRSQQPYIQFPQDAHSILRLSVRLSISLHDDYFSP